MTDRWLARFLLLLVFVASVPTGVRAQLREVRGPKSIIGVNFTLAAILD